MKFTLDASGAQQAGQGIGSLFKAFALGPQMRKQAELESMGNMAKIGQAQATARYANAKAGLDENQLAMQNTTGAMAMRELGLPESLSPAFESKVKTGGFGGGYDVPAVDGVGPVMPAPGTDDQVRQYGRFLNSAHKMFATGSNVQQGAQADGEYKKQRFMEQAAAAPDTETMNRLISVGSGKAYLPHDNVGNTGYSINKATGTGGVLNPLLAKIFQAVEASKFNENNAQAGSSGASAGLANARRERVTGGYDKTTNMVGDDGVTTIIRLPTGGAPVSVGVAPIKGTGEAATNAKARNAVITAVEKELGTTSTDREIQAEVDRRMGRRGANKSPGAAPAETKIVEAPRDASQRKSGQVYNTPKGPLRWVGSGWVKP